MPCFLHPSPVLPSSAMHRRIHWRIMRGMMGHVAMRIIFALMDRDGDGTISLDEFQAAHERIFKAMDPDKDGTVSQEEMLDFMRGLGKSAPQH
jgi:Ca2+-binding EF-hand superfamily protein